MTDADLVPLLRHTTRAFEGSLSAALAGDKHAAREVLAGSTVRRATVSSVQDELRARTWELTSTRTEQLAFVADLACLGDLADRLARHVVCGGDPRPLGSSGRAKLAALSDAGGGQLRQMADRPLGLELDPSQRGCGEVLRDVADPGTNDSSATTVLCAAMAVVLLQASRHAAHAG